MSDEVSAPGDPSLPPADGPPWLAALNGSVATGELSPRYRLGLMLAAVAMVLLPAAYLAMIAAAGWLLWWHATANFEACQGNSFRFGLLYVAPLVFGGIGFVFMFKPLLARRPEEEAALTLRPEEQPELFAFVERLCACLQAPVPKQIDVHVDPASTGTGVRRGLLRIGLPLVEALTLREFAGALAHELGHSRQRTAMRAGRVVAGVHRWFFSAVFVTDRMDQRLEATARFSRSSLLRSLASVAQLFVFLTRLLMLVLMIAGRLVSGFLMRQMELDADRYLIGVAGGEAAQSTLRKSHTLVFAWNLVHENLQAAWVVGRVPDDLPAMTVLQGTELSGELAGQIDAALRASATSALDVEASPAERMAQAERSAVAGLPFPAAPATDLFRDYRSLCRAATLAYYEHVLGAEISKLQLIDTDIMVREHEEQREADRTLYRYFQGQLLGHVEIFLPEGWLAAPPDAEQAIRALRQARQGMHAALPQLAAALDRFERAENRRCQAFTGQLLQAAQVRFKPADVGLAAGDVVAIGKAQEEGWQLREQALGDLQGFVRQAEIRLTTALCLLHADLVAGKINDPETLPRIARLNSVLGDLRVAWPHVQPLREHLFGLGMLMSRAEENSRNGAYWSELKRVGVIVHDLLGKLRQALAGTPYPFEHAAGDVRVTDYLLDDEIPPAEHVGELSLAAEQVLARLLSLYFRVMAQLAVTAERVEAVLGLPRLPDPPEPESRR